MLNKTNSNHATQHDLFHRDKPHLLADMKRATHYGVAADKQEVEHLRSEVSRLRHHIVDMGDKIGQLTTLVEALAVDRKPSSLPSLSRCSDVGSGGVAGLVGLANPDGVQCGALNSGHGDGLDSFVFGGGEEDLDVDAKFSASPSVPVSMAAVFPPFGQTGVASLSRKRKSMGFDSDDDDNNVNNNNNGDEKRFEEEREEGVGRRRAGEGGIYSKEDGRDDAMMPWPSDLGVVKQEASEVNTMSTQGGRARAAPWTTAGSVRNTVKQEIEDGQECSEAPRWHSQTQAQTQTQRQGGCCPSTVAENTTVATLPSLGATIPHAGCPGAAGTLGLSNGGGGGDFLESFTAQFLTFDLSTSPTTSYMLPDRAGGDIGPDSSGGDDGGGGGSGGGGLPCSNDVVGSTCGSGDATSASNGEEEGSIDICGDGISNAFSASGGVGGLVVPAAVVAPGVPLAEVRSLSMPPQALSHPIAPIPPKVEEELQNNLECLPADSKIKVRY